jgi:glycosyltransferase involved in cell wall biosynthesis
MKVVQLLPDLDGGGVERGTLEVAKALVDAGHESVVISAGGRMVAQLEAEGSRHVSWDLGKKSLWTFRHVWALRRWLRAERPDILHLRSRLPAWVAWFAWRGIKPAERPHLVTTVHGLYSVGRYSSIMCRGERVIAVSETVKTYIRENYPETDMNRVRLIYRGIDPAEFPFGYQPSPAWLEQWRTDFPQLQGKQVITLAGRLTRLKGHNDLIDMIRTLVAQGQPVHALIVGGEDAKRKAYAAELYKRVNDEGLSDHITFTGARADIRDIYAVSDLVLSLSTKPESFGRTVAEALGQGVPVVGYDHGGVGEILSALYPQGKTPLKDAKALVQTVSAVLASGVRPQGNQTFLKTTMLAQTLAVYEELVTQGSQVQPPEGINSQI